MMHVCSDFIIPAEAYLFMSLFSLSVFILSCSGHYGHSLHFWDWTERKHIQEVDLGTDGLIPLELRFLHDPNATQGYVGAALSSNMIRFYRDEVGVQRQYRHALSLFIYWAAEALPPLPSDHVVVYPPKCCNFQLK